MADLYISWRRFKRGLALFICGVGLLLTVGHLAAVYYLSLAILLTGFAIAMWGYAGIFLSRFAGLKNNRFNSKK
ncbi:hypothetical protein [Alteromonas halophila]|uniref:Uncharacterized protein n=1 Tax=Alteromonas halophila TaxID=516698 RepID=A0A918JN48_9ALTE|nr:hypothetical protein [Alteromonas halophila]GGW90965.1 hypothetical protein GCM10007391_26600 [Alteromonas halophila]